MLIGTNTSQGNSKYFEEPFTYPQNSSHVPLGVGIPQVDNPWYGVDSDKLRDYIGTLLFHTVHKLQICPSLASHRQLSQVCLGYDSSFVRLKSKIRLC